MAEDNTKERLAVLEQKVEHNSSRIVNQAVRIEKLEGDNNTLVRMATLLEVQSEMNKQQNEQMSKFGTVLENVNLNLSNLNSKYAQMESNMETMGEEVKGIKKAQKEEAAKSTVHVPEVLTKIIIGILLLSVTVVGAFLLKGLGLK